MIPHNRGCNLKPFTSCWLCEADCLNKLGVYGYSSFKFPILAYVCHSGPNFAGWVFSAEMSLWNELLKDQPLLEFSICL